MAVIVIVIALALVAAVVWIARNRARYLIYPPRRRFAQTPDDYGLTGCEDVSFPTRDGLRIAAWFIPPTGDNGATVVYVHGFGSNRGEMLPQAAMLAKHGYGALLIDLRNCGDSEGTATTLGHLEPLDVAAAVDYLLTRRDVNPDRIGLLGVSLGASSVIRAAAVVPEVRAVVAESGFSSIQDNVNEGVRRLLHLPPFPFAPLVTYFAEREVGRDMNAVRPIDDVGKIAPRALLLIHGSEDRLMHADNSRRLFAAAGEPKELWIVPGGHHVDLMELVPQEFETRIVAFLEWSLQPSPPAPLPGGEG